MSRCFFAVALFGGMLTFSGCGGPTYPFSDDFNQGISPSWNVEQDGLKVEEAKGELHIFGTTRTGGFARSGVKTKEIFPERDFSASVDFRVPEFSGKGAPLVYLIAYSKGGKIGVLYFPRFPDGYQLQDLSQGRLTETFPALGDEKTKYHRLRLDYDYQNKRARGYIDDKLIASREGSNMSGCVGFELCIAGENPGMKADVFYDNFSVVSPLPPDRVPKAEETAANRSNNDSKPEDAIVKFMLAMTKGDKTAIDDAILPNPESSILVEGKHLPENALFGLETKLRQAGYKRLKPGDSFPIDEDTDHKISSLEINENRVFITTDDSPIPFLLVRSNGVWKVDARQIIALRKEAATAAGKQ